ncbi:MULTISPECIES: hypothetical protein [Helicobacter]|uniref:Uncharacterized protein n=1 Tax=Helicobacter ibis TaxID=2962633 RepID=A0ABT4VH68_9HELI|nr:MULTISPECIES: hypothetical protein [Helicobacter]MDA3967756.1 hypothetical protein [Helicobacter sp. WB40]MDA3969475.1 hypothetical protein [Helicobacter ibis]
MQITDGFFDFTKPVGLDEVLFSAVIICGLFYLCYVFIRNKNLNK